jgi:polynucleotide 5'-kinase involved in rRNA processing
MEGHCSTGQSPQWAVVSMEEEEEGRRRRRRRRRRVYSQYFTMQYKM